MEDKHVFFEKVKSDSPNKSVFESIVRFSNIREGKMWDSSNLEITVYSDGISITDKQTYEGVHISIDQINHISSVIAFFNNKISKNND